MDVQNIIAALLVLAAFAYAASSLIRKGKMFSKRSACSDGCGCASKSKTPDPIH